MERLMCIRMILAAVCSLIGGMILTVLALFEAIPIETFMIGISSVLGSIGLLYWIGIQLWSAMHEEIVAYRVLYRADQPPDGIAAARMLDALARSAGHVSLIWHLQPGKAQFMSAASVQVDPVDPAPTLSGVSNQAHTQVKPAMAFTECCPSPPADISLFIAAPASARKALEGMLTSLLPGTWAERCELPVFPKPSSHAWETRSWRWAMTSANSGSLADPFACGAHLNDLPVVLQDLQGSPVPGGAHQAGEIGEIEVRLKLWTRGASAIVTALCPHAKSSRLSGNQGVTLQKEPGRLSGSSLKPLLGSWRFMPARLRTTLAGMLVSSYPLWEVPQTTMPEQSVRSGRMRRHPEAAQTIVASDAGNQNGSVRKHKNGSIGYSGRVINLLFPPTVRQFSSLDSIAAGDVPMPPSYALPTVSSQALVLGRSTCDGRLIGVPALRCSQDIPDTASARLAEHLGSYSDTHSSLKHSRSMRSHLHPMLAERLLVVGGNDAWRRDVAGSMVSQALEIGMAVVSIDGGSPSDEPPWLARHRSRVVSGDMRHSGSVSRSGGFAALRPAFAGGADPLSHVAVHSVDPALIAERVAQIDLDNPAGSLHPNMLYVPALAWLPVMEGEAIAALVALQTGLVAQMRFLQGVNVTGMDVGIGPFNMTYSEDGGPGLMIMEAWLTLLLLRHHRSRLSVASRISVAVTIHSQSPAGVSSLLSLLPPCPDLPTLMLVLEQSATLLKLLRREQAAWSDPAWVDLVRGMGGVAGEYTIQAAQLALARASRVEQINAQDMFLYGAVLRGQLKRIIGRSALMRMFSGPHVSLFDLLSGGSVRMLRVNLSGAYRTATPPYSEDDLARKHYGLYLLWSLWAMSQHRKMLNTLGGKNDHAVETARSPNRFRTCPVKPDPLLLMLHGAGAWFGAGSPLSDTLMLEDLSQDSSDIAVMATVSGLRHLRSYRARACEVFGNLVIGPAPVSDIDAPDVTRHLVDQEIRLLRDAMHLVASRASHAQDGDRLLAVLKHLDDGNALVVTGASGGMKAIGTAHVGSGVNS